MGSLGSSGQFWAAAYFQRGNILFISCSLLRVRLAVWSDAWAAGILVVGQLLGQLIYLGSWAGNWAVGQLRDLGSRAGSWARIWPFGQAIWHIGQLFGQLGRHFDSWVGLVFESSWAAHEPVIMCQELPKSLSLPKTDDQRWSSAQSSGHIWNAM